MARDAALHHEATIRAWLKGVPAPERSKALADAADGHGARLRRAEQRGRRRSRGTWYTPAELVEAVLERAMTARTCRRGTVCDPACGGGHFLVAAGRRMVAAGRSPSAVRGALLGTDIDARAVALTRIRLRQEFGGTAAEWRKAVRCADALRLPTWRPYACTIDAVVGNPPFLSGLKRRSAPSPSQARALRMDFGEAAQRYSNAASLFLVLGLQLARRGGCVALVLPLSTCAAADSSIARGMASECASMEACLLPPARIFGGGVPTMVPVLRRGGRSRGVRVVGICGGAPEEPTNLPWTGALRSGNWGAIVSSAHGIPAVRSARCSGTVGDRATATADFRQHFYGLRGKVRESPKAPGPARQGSWAPVVTVGVIDAARSLWGLRALKLLGRTYRRPVANLSALRKDPVMDRWIAARLRPKIVLATQTSAIEAWVDAEGAVLPSTPLISVYPKEGACIWKLGAALLSPPVAAIAWERHGGGGLSSAALKLSAGQIAELPLPRNTRAWQRAAERLRELQAHENASAGRRRGPRAASLAHARRAHLRARFAAAACDAYGVVKQAERKPLLEWWNSAVAGSRRE